MEKFCYEQIYDVVVVGGGVAGTVSAIAAGRMGAQVLVVEQNGYLGGALTSYGVGPMMTFHAGEKQVIRGLMEEIVQRMVDSGDSTGHIYDTMQYISYLTPFSSEGLKLVLDEMVKEAGCDVLFHTFLGGVNTDDERIGSLTICNKDGIHSISGKVYVDATGDGDLAAFAGAPMTKGRKSDGASQPMTMNMKYINVDTGKLKEYIKQHVETFERHKDHVDLMDSVKRFSFCGFQTEFREANQRGELDICREDVLGFETNTPGEFILNTTRVIDHDATNAKSLSDAEAIGRKQCRQLDHFLRTYVPGWEHAVVESTGPSIGVRGSRQLKGAYTLTAEDILERRPFESVIAHSSYPIDIHNPKGVGTSSHFLSEKGTYYSIPYEIFYCNELKNLLVTGRCVSATFEAQAAIRVSPSSGAMGHAVGVAAALAALAPRQDVDVSNIEIKKLQRLLKEQDAYLDI